MSTWFNVLLTVDAAMTGVQFGGKRLSVDSSVNPVGAVGHVRVNLPGVVRNVSSAGGVFTRRKNFCGPVIGTWMTHQPLEITGAMPTGDHFFKSTLTSRR